MAKAPQWITNIEQIQNAVEALDPKCTLTNTEIKGLFGVGRTEAYRIMTVAGDQVIDGVRTISREHLLAYVLSRRSEFQPIQARRYKLAHTLALEKAKKATAPVIVKPVYRMDRLSGDVRLGNGELRIRYSNGVDLAEKLTSLALAMMYDHGGFVALTDPAPLPSSNTSGQEDAICLDPSDVVYLEDSVSESGPYDRRANPGESPNFPHGEMPAGELGDCANPDCPVGCPDSHCLPFGE